MNNVTRDEFETVKELLASAARYAESAHRGLDRLELAQDRTQLQLDRLSVRMEELAEAQKRTEARLETFIFESQRLMSGHADRLAKLEGISERLEALLAYVIRKEGPGE